jgi:hypothetical protein|tara:strand:+ start:238 stop:1167 length:930 start_codon:yes stop_codon:yes gene_type:complete
MTVRSSLYNDGSNNLQEFTTVQNTTNQSQAIYQYSTDPSVTLTVGSGSNIGTRTDTRLQAGAGTTHVSSFQTPAGTSTVTVNYTNLGQNVASVTDPSDTNNVAYPVYYDGSDVRSMSKTDFQDTFIKPAIQTMVQTTSTGSDQAGTYTISTGTSLSNHTLISGTAVFLDTRANTGAYSASSLFETQDQPTTVTSYYVHRRNGSDNIGSCTVPMFADTSGNLEAYTNAEWQALLKNEIRRVAANLASFKIRYDTGATDTFYRGTAMQDTKFNGQTLAQQQINTDDYRSQFFPSGSTTVINTYYLRPYLES